MAGSSESAFLFLDTKNGAIAPVVIIHLLLQRPLFCISFSYDIARKVKLIPGYDFFIIKAERKKKEESYESSDYQLEPKKRR